MNSSGKPGVLALISSVRSISREDASVNPNQGGRIALFTYRLGHALVTPEAGWTPPHWLKAFHRALFVVLSVPQGCQLDPHAVIGRRLRLPHGGNGIVISSTAVIGDDVTLFHQVTLGTKDVREQSTAAPTIHDGVTIYVGAKVIGPVTVGAGSSVGANSVVLTDVAPGSTVVGIPSRPIC